MGIFGGSTLILVGYAYWATTGYLEQQTNATVQAEVTGLVEQYRQRGMPGLEAAIRARTVAGSGQSSLYLFADQDFRPLAGNLPAWPPGTMGPDGWYRFVHVNPAGDAIPARGQVFILSDGRRLLVAQDQARLEATRDLINDAFTWAVGFGLVLALVGGILMSYSVTRRIDAINRTSREIMTGRLKRRMPVRGVDDEFDQLAGNLNAMLDRIDSLIEGVRAVADNIAHDLRTPLTRLRGRLESLSARGDLGDDVQGELAACMGEADHLLSTFRALLRIARIESGTHDREWQELDLNALVTDAFELYHAVGEEKGIDVRFLGGDARVRGDQDLVFQAVSNLLDNAIKYSPPDSVVEVAVEDDGEGAAVVVADRGPGIPAGERDKVLDRFYRSSSVTGIPGSGLGLSLVNAIARHHGGRVELADNAPGLRIRLWLPRVPSGSIGTTGEVGGNGVAAGAGAR